MRSCRAAHSSFAVLYATGKEDSGLYSRLGKNKLTAGENMDFLFLELQVFFKIQKSSAVH